ncbi:MAG: phosphoribosylformylglycinamidine synthase subunit PurL [Ignavibacteria bacterium]|nr:phosphoribosylformylglycinamidine synthase subunit PurL [Ignavibacteria bacterium]
MKDSCMKLNKAKTMTEEPEINTELAKSLGLLEEEYEKIIEYLGRIPTYTELGMYSVMWSEHCSYKNSILEIKKLPRSGGRLLVNAGEENAGLVDIGDNLAVAFKIESHNHPSAVEPYQGAATGVGGILRDIFTMGARPVAALNSLRFGELNKGDERTKYLFRNVVKGIGDYGNSFGVPTIAGEIYFEECYRDNPLVNAMAVGIVKQTEVARSVAKGKGNPVFIVGSSTGRDGIHGATFASEEISEESESKRPSVQVGDPFTEKLLLEATLELIKSGVVIGMQDMGAAGITCSTCEMSAKGNSGMEINLDLVPVRESNMSAYEIMLSESQERMLVVIEKGKEEIAKKIFEKWDLNCVQIGHITDDGRVKVYYKGKLEADVPAESLVLGGGAPVYVRDFREPSYIKTLREFDENSLQEPGNYNEVLLQLLSSPDIANKKWVYEQYDTQVRTNTVILPGGDASVIRLKGTNKALSVKTDCNASYVYLNPYKGGMIAVCEAARNVACTGAVPIAITNCLNFGNPYDPEIYWQFREALRGIGDACRILETPVTGGNVSFYNESPERAVYPTPVIGMLGLIENLSHITTSYFNNEGDSIAVIGNLSDKLTLGGSRYLKVIHNLLAGDAPDIDPYIEKKLIDCLLRLISSGKINSAHDVSDGGLAIALTESCIMNRRKQLGCKVELNINTRPDHHLFSEAQSRIIISYNPADEESIKETVRTYGLDFLLLGKTGGNKIIINETIDLNIEIASEAYYNAISHIMNNKV